MSPAVQATLDRLDDTRQRWWYCSVAGGTILWAAVTLILLQVGVLSDVCLGLSRRGLWFLFLVWLSVSLSFAGAVAWRALRQRRSLEAAARCVELAFPAAGNNLVVLMQLSRLPFAEADPFHRAAIAEAMHHSEALDFDRAAESERRIGRLIRGLLTPRDLLEYLAAFGLIIALGAIGHSFLPAWDSSAHRLLTPWAFVPQVGRVQIVEVIPGNAEVVVGASVDIVARVEHPGKQPPVGTLYLIDAAGVETAQPLAPDATGNRYSSTLPAVLETTQYRLQVGDTQSEIYRLGVQQPPTIEAVEVTYEYPAYLDQPEHTVQQSQADVEAPQFTRAYLKVRSTKPLREGFILWDDQRLPGTVEEEGRTLRTGLTMMKAGSFTIHLVNEFGHTDAAPRQNQVRTVLDEPPKIQIAQPERERALAVGGELEIVVRASDDHGLGEVRLELQHSTDNAADASSESTNATTSSDANTKSNDPAPSVIVLERWNKLANAAAVTRSFSWKPQADTFHVGQSVKIRAVAVDRRHFELGSIRLEPQETATSWLKIQFVDAAQQSAATIARLESLNGRVWAILQQQLKARLQTATLTHDSTRRDELVGEIHALQGKIQVGTVELCESLTMNKENDDATALRVLKKAAYGDMLTAVQQAEAMRRADPTQLVASTQPLQETQDRIIDQLRQLLDATRQSLNKELSAMQERPGGDLPPDVTGKLAQLDEKLREFAKQQRKVLEATESLAKKPVEDFTEEDEQLLKKLAAIEEDWSRFMEETHSDFSKLPEQDFSNPSLLEELVEVQNELKMAAGALTKKTADIAVPLEQLGAEMAEEMTTNIEKWLPDTPDRERWSQEEPLADDMKEAPMAELPGELEDLVGDLMEDEEDLFDEMEDVSSSWADSIDKGAGWDAMDGPISNNSARGVTGNRLPNNSEIAGRSGEGRQGQASGEFVSDSAVGKGGRKTPSRLAPDPFQKGQVKDTSKDPVGGATGGGKESGVGGEGLEGPVPHRPEREVERLASKQAELRNRAEAIDLKFQIHNYHRTDLKKLMDAMASVEHDLRAGRYENALRRRQVLLDGLGNVKTYLRGEFELRRDDTANLPEEIQKEMLGGISDATPAGWEDWNRRYFERLK